MSRIDDTPHVPDESCECNHGKSIHFMHDNCTGCKSDFCRVTNCGCMAFKRRIGAVRRPAFVTRKSRRAGISRFKLRNGTSRNSQHAK